YSQVNALYGSAPEQTITTRVGLPLNSFDGGTSGIQGAWNGRTQGLGGGGCAGNLTVTAPVNAGYVGSGTDTGHTGGDCEPGVNLDGTYNLQFIEDFIRNAIKQQVLLSKSIKIGSGTDTGHTGGDCEPGVNLDGTYNLQFIEDFIRNAIKQQVLLSKSIARTYYGMAPAYNYWNGCSTGG